MLGGGGMDHSFSALVWGWGNNCLETATRETSRCCFAGGKDLTIRALEKTGQYLTKLMYRFLSHRGVINKRMERLWNSKLPLKLKMFMWLAVQGMSLKPKKKEGWFKLIQAWRSGWRMLRKQGPPTQKIGANVFSVRLRPCSFVLPVFGASLLLFSTLTASWQAQHDM